MKRKLMSIFVLMVFLISLIPASLAGEGNGDGDGDGTDDKPILKAHKVGANKPWVRKARVINHNLVKRYQTVKGEFEKAREFREDAREKFQLAKEEYKACQDSDTEECTQMKDAIKERSKNFLLHSADMVIQHLEKIKSKIETSERLTEEEVAEITADIDVKIAEIEEAKAAVEAAETKEEIKAAAKQMRDAWKPIRLRAMYWIGHIINARMGGIIVKVDHLNERLEKTLEKMEENGKDTSVAEGLIDEFNALLESAKDNFETSKEHYQDFKETKSKESLEEGKKYMRLAKEDLVDAHKKLKEIVRAIKEANGDEELEEAEEEEECSEEVACDEGYECIEGQCVEEEEENGNETA